MRRVIVAFAVWVVAVSPVWAACGGSSPNWTAASAALADVQACVDGATAGDTITVSGNATWAAALELTRGLRLIGSGSPVITVSGVNAIQWITDASARSAHDTLTVQGFVFDGSNSSWSGGLVAVASAFGGHVSLAITNNTFRNVVSRAIYVQGNVRGVAAANTLDRVGMAFGVFGNDASSWGGLSQAYGTGDVFYFENNTIQASSSMSGDFGWTETGQGGSAVVRYNTWDFTNYTSGYSNLWDQHGLQYMLPAGCAYGPPNATCDPTIKNCQQYSTMSAEYYGNAIINAPYATLWMLQRGGWLLMFANSYAAASGTATLLYNQFSCDSCQETGSSVQHIANSYYWNNFGRGSRVLMAKGLDACADFSTGSPYTITANRDFFNDVAGTGDGTVGVGCGTLAARPATCTFDETSGTGPGYWATNQSCSDMTGLVGTSPSTPISGTLYKCTATDEWTPYYTPYTYPHPLASSSAPNAPTNVRIR
jgi:hypothetical protein